MIIKTCDLNRNKLAISIKKFYDIPKLESRIENNFLSATISTSIKYGNMNRYVRRSEVVTLDDIVSRPYVIKGYGVIRSTLDLISNIALKSALSIKVELGNKRDNERRD